MPDGEAADLRPGPGPGAAGPLRGGRDQPQPGERRLPVLPAGRGDCEERAVPEAARPTRGVSHDEVPACFQADGPEGDGGGGRPAAVRAVGAANGANPVAIIVPCHRVIGSNGTLTGYGGGLPTKAWLLALEGIKNKTW